MALTRVDLNLISPVERRLDRDIWVDRTPEQEIEPPELAYPERITIGESYEIPILNYNADYDYEVEVNTGSVIIQSNIIYYTAPPETPGELVFTITITPTNLIPLALFPDGTSYDYDGNLVELPKTASGNFKIGTTEIIYSDLAAEVEYEKDENDLRRTHPSIDSASYNPSNDFGSLGSKRVTDKTPGYRNGSIADYGIPASYDKSPNDTPYLYELNGNRFTGRPRNSNVSQVAGDAFYGYSSVRAPGSSLAVNRGEFVPVRFVEENAVKLYDLGAIVPAEILSLCLDEFEFTPILQGIDIGHFFEWEQVSGDQSDIVRISLKLYVENFSGSFILNERCFTDTGEGRPVFIDTDDGYFKFITTTGTFEIGQTITGQTSESTAVITDIEYVEPITLSVVIGDLKVDRVFRFYISRGTEYEKYYDMTLLGTPTDYVKAGVGNFARGFSGQGKHVNIHKKRVLPVVLTHKLLYNKQLRIEVDKNY